MIDAIVLDQRMREIAANSQKMKGEAIELVREIHKRQLWKTLGYKSVKDFCLKHLRYSELDTREILIALGEVLTQAQMKDDRPEVQRRIDNLIAWRREKASKLASAPYVIFSNRSLMAIAKSNPKTAEELAQVHGVGQKRADRFGPEVLSLLSS